MKPLFKWLLVGGAALLLLVAGALVAVATLVDAQQLRPAIVGAVQKATGRSLDLGSIGLKLFPCCALDVADAELGSPPGFAAEPFLRIRSARLALRIWPLLTRREVRIGTVRIAGLDANLSGRKDGSNNWTFGQEPSGGVPAEPEAATGGKLLFNVAGIEVEDARLNYSDETDGTRYRVEQLQLATGPVSAGEPFDLDTAFRLTDLTDDSGGDFKVKARTGVAVEGDVSTLSLAGLEVDVETRGLGGLAAIGGNLRAPALVVRLASDTRIEAAALTIDLQLKDDDLPDGALPVKATLTDFRYDVDPGTGSVGSLAATTTVVGVPLDLKGKGRFGATTDLRGTVRFPEFSLREVLPKLKQDVPNTADPGVLGKLSGSSGWFLGDTAFGLEKLAVVLDDTAIAGSLSQELLPAGSTATPRTRFDLTIDALDADRYLEPDAPASSRGSSAEGPGPKPTEIPAQSLRGLNLEGRARIGRLTISDLRLAEVDVTTAAAGGRVRLEPLAAKLYGGAVRGGLRLDGTGDKTRVSIDQKVSGVDFGALLGDFADVKNISGTASLNLAGTAVGGNTDELLASLGGNLTFSLADGLYQGMDVWYEIRRARALLRRKAPPARSGPEQTPIKVLDLAGKLVNGQLRTDRFAAEIPFLRVSGDATVDLPQGTLDSELTALVFEKPVFGEDDSLADLVDSSLPLTISGPVAEPKVRVDLSKMVQGVLKETVRKTVEDKLREKLGLGKPAEDAPPADGAQTAPSEPKEDPVKNALDRLFKKL